jgi:hypothetical protein
MARFNLALSGTHYALIDDLKELCDLQTGKDVVENALMLLGWAAAESAKGLSIASVDEGRKVYREVQTPALLGARMKADRARKAAAVKESAAQPEIASQISQQEDAPAPRKRGIAVFGQ